METLLEKKLSGAPVVDDDKGVVGILSEKDCVTSIPPIRRSRSVSVRRSR